MSCDRPVCCRARAQLRATKRAARMTTGSLTTTTTPRLSRMRCASTTRASSSTRAACRACHGWTFPISCSCNIISGWLSRHCSPHCALRARRGGARRGGCLTRKGCAASGVAAAAAAAAAAVAAAVVAEHARARSARVRSHLPLRPSACARGEATVGRVALVLRGAAALCCARVLMRPPRRRRGGGGGSGSSSGGSGGRRRRRGVT
jgi:hypothetical protein